MKICEIEGEDGWGHIRSFSKLVFQGNLTAAIKLLDSESSTGLLNLTPEVLEGLKEKHPEAADIADESL